MGVKKIIYLLIIVLLLAESCYYMGNKNVSNRTFNELIGTFSLDLNKTNLGGYTSEQYKNLQITFKNDSTFSATTDCNAVGGTYVVTGNKIVFSKMMSTLMYCDGSQEQIFTKMLGEVKNYLFTSKGELILDLDFDSGTMTFR